jgi:hypothetical protein
MGIIGTAEHYAAFIKLCKLRIEQLGIAAAQNVCFWHTNRTLPPCRTMSAFGGKTDMGGRQSDVCF